MNFHFPSRFWLSALLFAAIACSLLLRTPTPVSAVTPVHTVGTNAQSPCTAYPSIYASARLSLTYYDAVWYSVDGHPEGGYWNSRGTHKTIALGDSGMKSELQGSGALNLEFGEYTAELSNQYNGTSASVSASASADITVAAGPELTVVSGSASASAEAVGQYWLSSGSDSDRGSANVSASTRIQIIANEAVRVTANWSGGSFTDGTTANEYFLAKGESKSLVVGEYKDIAAHWSEGHPFNSYYASSSSYSYSGNFEITCAPMSANLTVTSAAIRKVSCTDNGVVADVDLTGYYENPANEGTGVDIVVFVNEEFAAAGSIPHAEAAANTTWYKTLTIPDLLQHIADPDQQNGKEQIPIRVVVSPTADIEEQNLDDNETHTNYNFALPIDCPCTPEITSIDSPKEPVNLQTWYTVTVVVSVPAHCPIALDVTVNGGETEIRAAPEKNGLRGDALVAGMKTPSGESSPKKRIQPGESATYEFGSIHDWDWTGMRDKSCVAGVSKDALLEVGINKLKEAKRAGVLIAANEIKEALETAQHLLLLNISYRHSYGMRFTAETNFNHRSSRSVTATDPSAPSVNPDVRRVAGYQSLIAFSKGSSYATVRGLGALPIAPKLAYAAFAVEGVLGVAYCATWQDVVMGNPAALAASRDSTSLPSLESLPDSAGKQLALASLSANDVMLAIGALLDEHEGANNTRKAEIRAEVLTLLEEYGELAVEIDLLAETLLAEWHAAGVPTDAPALASAKQELLENGLPQIELDILRDAGLTDADIEAFTQVAIDSIDTMSDDWEDEMLGAFYWPISLRAITQTYIDENFFDVPGVGDVETFLPMIGK